MLLFIFGVLTLVASAMTFMPRSYGRDNLTEEQVSFSKAAAVIIGVIVSFLIGLVGQGGAFITTPLIHGAGHEQGRRAGTENVLRAAGLGAACSIAAKWIGRPQIQELRDRFWDRLRELFGNKVSINGHPTERLPNTLNVNFIGRKGAEILSKMPEVAASTGSACHSDSVTLSPVLAAMGVLPEVGMGAVRFSLGRTTTWEELEIVLNHLRTTSLKIDT